MNGLDLVVGVLVAVCLLLIVALLVLEAVREVHRYVSWIDESDTDG